MLSKKIVIALALAVTATTALGAHLPLTKAEQANPSLQKLDTKKKDKPHKWARFLLNDMPTIDLVTVDGDSLLADLAALEENVDSLLWGKDIPDEIFMRYVLPYSVSQEPMEYFRAHWGARLYERVKDCDNMHEAALRINEWAYERMKYEPTARWDQSAEETVRRGIGRCEEMATLFIKGCRAVGIPARNVYSPWWPFTNSNHAWVEVWTGPKEGWLFVGGAEMSQLGNAWFMEAGRRAAVVRGIAWGEFEPDNELVYLKRKGSGFTVLDLTPNYTDTTGVSVTVLDSLGNPLDSIAVWASVYNYSSIRSVARRYTDKDGVAHFVVGKTDIFFSAGDDSTFDYALLPYSLDSGTARLTLTLKRSVLPDTSFWMHTHRVEKLERDTAYTPPQISYVRHDLVQEQLEAVDKDALALLPDTSFAHRLLDDIDRSRGNSGTIIAVYKAHPDEKEFVVSLFDAMHTKDLVAADSIQLENVIACAERARKRFDEYDFPDSLFFDYVANPRILYENFGDWCDALYDKFEGIAGAPRRAELAGLAEKVMKFVRTKLDTLSDRDYFGGMMNPEQTLKARRGGKAERLEVFIGAMRVLGIPAKMGWDYHSAEFYDGDEWKRVEIKADEADDTTEEQESALVVKFYRNGKNVSKDVGYYDDFSLNRLGESGRFDDITPPLAQNDDSAAVITVPHGKYYFITGWRNAFGDVYVRLKPVSVANDTVMLTVDMGFPPAGDVAPGDLLVRKFKKLKLDGVESTDGKALTDDDSQNGTVIAAFFDIEHEKSLSTMRRLAEIEGIPMLLFVDVENRAAAVAFCRKNGLKGRIVVGSRDDFKKIVRIGELPSIILIKDGDAILWSEGLNLEIDKLIEGMVRG